MAAFASKGMSSRNSRRKWRVPVASFVLLLVILSAYMVCFVLLTLTPNTASASNEESRWEVPRTAERGSQSHNLDYNLDYVHFPPKEPQGPLDEEVVRNLSSKSFPYSPPFGFVMRDFARRVLSRHISNSNVLVIASDATAAAKDAIQSIKENKESNPYDHVDFQSPYSVGGTFLLHASAEGHGIHAIDAGVDKKGTLIESSHSLGDWWSSFGNKIIKNNNWWSSTRESKPKWIIAAVIDIDFGHEDSVWQGAETFLQESTITYFVVAMHSRKDQGGKYEYGGLAATSALLSRRYKLQTLLVSHYHADPGEESQTAERYGPNALFQSTGQTKEFLRWGADSATQYNGNNSVFTAYIFATQGLDLAIPSSRVFLHEESRIIGDESTKQINVSSWQRSFK